MQLSKELIDKIENAGFSVSHEEGNDYYFSRYSTAGQDFGFSIDTGEDIAEFARNVLRHYEDFDVSYEAYLWLDENGHGKNGAPYDMRDLYNDMEECEGFISELYDLLMEEDD